MIRLGSKGIPALCAIMFNIPMKQFSDAALTVVLLLADGCNAAHS